MERKPMFASKKGNVTRSETFAMKVESYDTSRQPHVVRGKRLDTGAEATVFLRQVEYTQNGRFARSEITDFAAPRKDRQHPGTAIGGTLLVQDALLQGDGTFGARWIQSLSHTEGEAEVLHATIHVTPVKYGKKTRQYPEGRPYAVMTMLHDGDFQHLSKEMQDTLKLIPPFQVENVEELKTAVSELLDDDIGVGVRVSNPDGFDAQYVSKKQGMTTEQAVNAFMGNIAEMADKIDSGELTCEVVPYGNVWAGPATTDIMAKSKVVLGRLKRYNESGIGRNDAPYPINVFRPSIVAVRFTPFDNDGNRSVYFSHFEPLMTRNPVHNLVNAIAYAKSEHLSPEPPRLDSGDKPAAPAAGSRQEPNHTMDGDSFDGGMDMSQDPLMDGMDDQPAAPAPAPVRAQAPAPAPAPAPVQQQAESSGPRRYNTRRA